MAGSSIVKAPVKGMEAMESSGIVFTFLTGAVWAAVGVCFSVVARGRTDFFAFMLCYALIATSFSWLVFPDYTALKEASLADCLLVAAAMLPYGALGMAGFWAVRQAMRCGRNGVVWALAQSAIVFPFLFSVAIFGQRPSVAAWVGFCVLAGAIVVLALDRKEISDSYKKGWMGMAFAAFVLIGVSQVFSLLPERMAVPAAAQTLRVPLMASAGLLWVIPALCCRSRVDCHTLGWATLYALLVAGGQYGLFRALDAMGRSGRTGLVFPLAIGISIVLFFLYSRWVLGERAGAMVVVAIGAVALGVVLMAFQ